MRQHELVLLTANSSPSIPPEFRLVEDKIPKVQGVRKCIVHAVAHHGLLRSFNIHSQVRVSERKEARDFALVNYDLFLVPI